MNALNIKQVEESELPILDATFGSEFNRSHADDLNDQLAGDKMFLVAWFRREPIGHALVRWLGPRASIPWTLYPDCPEIYRLAVLEPFQRQGIASAIIHKCEEAAAGKGYSKNRLPKSCTST